MQACAEEAPASSSGRLSDRRRRPISDKRLFPLDLSSIGDAAARDLIERYRPIINDTVKRYLPGARATFHVIRREDLCAVAESAVLEAAVRYRVGDEGRDNQGGGLATWVRRVVGWRVSESVQNLLVNEPLQSERVYNEADPTSTWSTNVHVDSGFRQAATQHTIVQARQVVEWLQRSLGSLTPRRRIIIVSVLRGEAKTSIARSLGISPGRVSQEYKTAVEQLRKLALRDGIDYQAPET